MPHSRPRSASIRRHSRRRGSTISAQSRPSHTARSRPRPDRCLPDWNAPAPGSSVVPLPSRAPAGAGSSGDLTGPIILIVAIIAVVTLVAGIFLTATRLGRGEPLLPETADAVAADAEAGAAQPLDADRSDPDRE